jgi:alpha-tubulin suppressor-like RCC1 family protein
MTPKHLVAILLVMVGWGATSSGDTGTGVIDTTPLYMPTLVDIGSHVPANEYFTQIARGSSFGCGWTDPTDMYCWGSKGALGNETWTANQASTVKIDGGGIGVGECPVQMVASEDWLVLLTDKGKLYSWGANRALGIGTLGNGQAPAAAVMQAKPLMVDQTYIPAGVTFAKLSTNTSGSQCALSADHHIYCWGRNDMLQIDPSGATIASPKRLCEGGIQ